MSNKPKKFQSRPHHLQLVRGSDRLMAGRVASMFAMAGDSWSPAADVCETAEELLIVLDVSGMDAEELSIYQRDRMILVQGQRLRDEEAATASYHQVEIPAGPFEKVFHFNDYLDLARVVATYHHGVLKLRIAKTTKAPREAIFLRVRLQETT